MKYENITKGKFISRRKRFKAYVELNGEEEVVHVKNTGRCAELLKAGACVYVQESDKKERKTKWDLIAVEKGKRMINMDSQIPNRVVKEWLEQGHLFENITCIRPEYTYGNSRFDLYVEAGERKIFIEVKGVTLEEDGLSLIHIYVLSFLPDQLSLIIFSLIIESGAFMRNGVSGFQRG